MFNLEMDILIIVIHMFLSFFKMPFDGSKFFAVSEIKQSCGVKRVPKSQKWVIAKGNVYATLRHKKAQKGTFSDFWSRGNPTKMRGWRRLERQPNFYRHFLLSDNWCLIKIKIIDKFYAIQTVLNQRVRKIFLIRTKTTPKDKHLCIQWDVGAKLCEKGRK